MERDVAEAMSVKQEARPFKGGSMSLNSELVFRGDGNMQSKTLHVGGELMAEPPLSLKRDYSRLASITA
jgi:hypothetical protein